MRLKSLELYGFKSFADRTKLDFEPGMTCIVGPNGCGKSNVTDALRWVMGEQGVKTMRGDERNDVIFAGTQKRKALGLAEVAVTFDNTDRRLLVDTDEVSVGRRLYRTGESEYFINKELCRLKDVKDLLMDSGLGTTSYCFIQQGQIDKLLNSNAKERRLVFEEAAGISKYRTRKAAALRKLDRVDRNLEYLNTIRDEVRKSYQRANRQAQVARRCRRYMDELREKQIVLALAEFRVLLEEKDKVDRELARVRGAEAAAAAEAAGAEARVTESEVEEVEFDTEARRAEELRAEAQAAAERLEAEAAAAGSRAEELARQVEAGGREIAALAGRVDERRGELARLEESRKELDGAVAAEEASLKEAKAATEEAVSRAEDLALALKSWRDEAFATVQAHSEAQNALTRAESELKSLGHTVERLEGELARIDRAYGGAHERAERANGLCGRLGGRIEKANASAAATRKTTGSLERQLAGLDEMIAKQRGDVEAKKARLSFLVELVQRADGVAAGAYELLKAVKEGEAELGRTYGLVADLVRARPKFETAIEAAMGSLASDVVVDSGTTAARAIDFLSRGQLGRASFLPLDRMRRTLLIPEELTREQGVLGRGCDLLEYAPRFRPVFEYLLGRVLVVESREVALRLAQLSGPGTRMVTLGGEIVDGTGPMTGGVSKEARPGLLSRKTEIRGLKGSLKEASRMLQTLLAQRKRLDGKRRGVRGRADRLAAEAQRLERLLGEARAELASLRKEEKKLNERRFAAAAEFDETRRDRDKVAEEIEKLRSRSQELEAQQGAAQKKAESISAEIELARGKRQSRERDLADRQIALAGLREKLTGQLRAVDDLRAQVEEREQSLRARRDELRRNEERVGELLRRAEEAKRGVSSTSEELERLAAVAHKMRARRDERRAQLESLRSRAREARGRHNQAQSVLGDFRVKEGDIDLRLEAAEQRAASEFGVSLAERLAAYAEAADRREVRRTYEAAVAAGLESGEDYVAELGLERPSAESSPLAEPEAAGEGDGTGDEAVGEPDYEAGVPEPTPELRAEIEELERKMRAMGTVNMYALDEAKELGERASFLDGQWDDLSRARRSLKEVIAKVNRKSRALFQETFDAVRANFQELFRKLFGGGKADIFLEEGEDVLEAGIEIKARPPGREELPLSALSGGQKAMTTIALLLGIFRTKPSPFCILDEVDAPLDDANVERYNRILEEYTDKTQFIVITHNKTTMGFAPVLYGVTMQEPGVSQKVSIRFEEVGTEFRITDDAAKGDDAQQAKAA